MAILNPRRSKEVEHARNVHLFWQMFSTVITSHKKILLYTLLQSLLKPILVLQESHGY